MTGSGGAALPLLAWRNSSHMSSLSPLRLREHPSRCSREHRVSARGGLLLRGGTSPAARVWWSSLLLFTVFCVLISSAHSDELSQNRTALNREIYIEAFRSFSSLRTSKTGIIYNVTLPGNITNASVEVVQMVRLRSGSLTRYGLRFNEIYLPPRAVKVVEPHRKVLLVYRKFSQYPYYNTTVGDMQVSTVFGILGYGAGDPENYTALRPELTIISTISPIQVELSPTGDDVQGNVTCVLYDNSVNGTGMANATSAPASGPCLWTLLGDFAILVPPVHHRSTRWKKIVGAVVGSVVGGILLLVLLVLLAFLAVRWRERAKFANMEHKSEHGETLHHTFIGGSRAPAAASTRTKPILESEYVS